VFGQRLTFVAAASAVFFAAPPACFAASAFDLAAFEAPLAALPAERSACPTLSPAALRFLVAAAFLAAADLSALVCAIVPP